MGETRPETAETAHLGRCPCRHSLSLTVTVLAQCQIIMVRIAVLLRARYAGAPGLARQVPVIASSLPVASIRYVRVLEPGSQTR